MGVSRGRRGEGDGVAGGRKTPTGSTIAMRSEAVVVIGPCAVLSRICSPSPALPLEDMQF